MIHQITNKIKKNQIKNCEKRQIIEIFEQFNAIFSIETVEKTDCTSQDDILDEITEYLNIINSNDYYNYECPNCKCTGFLKANTSYTRDIIVSHQGYLITGKIKLIVLKCSHCSELHKKDENVQQYHALLPEFIVPYHSYSGEIIINCLNDKINNNEKIPNLEEKYNASYQLIYYWIKIMKKYELVSSIILKMPNDIKCTIKQILSDYNIFVNKFYLNYYHPFFLFKKTCVPLAITP